MVTKLLTKTAVVSLALIYCWVSWRNKTARTYAFKNREVARKVEFLLAI